MNVSTSQHVFSQSSNQRYQSIPPEVGSSGSTTYPRYGRTTSRHTTTSALLERMWNSEDGETEVAGNTAYADAPVESIESKSTASTHEVNGVKTKQVGTSAEWRPFWLQRIILLTFACLFLAFTIALLSMLLYSQRNDGLVKAEKNLANIWRFGPTAVLTLTAVFWSRVESQALRYTPWQVVKNKELFSPDVLHLDYRDMLLPQVIYQSLRRRHFLVFFATAAMIILRIHIILSPGLFELVVVPNTPTVDLQLLDSFAADADFSTGLSNHLERFEAPSISGPGMIDLGNGDRDMAYFNALATHDFDMVLPFGVAEGFAYERFRAAQGGPEARGTSNEPVTAVVDGLFTEVKCLEMESCEVVSSALFEPTGIFHYTVELRFPNCSQSFTFSQYEVAGYHMNGDQKTHWNIGYGHFANRTCSSLPQQHPPFIFHSSSYTSLAQNISLEGIDGMPPLDSCAAVICSPRSWLSRVEVVDDGVSPSARALPDQAQTNISSDIWLMLSISIPDLWRSPPEAWEKTLRQVRTLQAGPIMALQTFGGHVSNESDISKYRSAELYQAVTDLTRHLSPMVAHYQLRQTSDARVEGLITTQVQRLRINEAIGTSVVTLFAIIAGIALWTLFQQERIPFGYHRNPATILGSLVSFHGDTELSLAISTRLVEGRAERSAVWGYNTYTQLPLRRWLRVTFILYSLGLIVALLVTLNISERSDGLGIVDEENSSSLLWRSLPALSLLLIALYTSSSDLALRDLMTLSNISARPSDSRGLDVSLSDMLGVRVLYYAIRSNSHAISLAQATATLCGFLMIISALLFSSELVPGSRSTTLEQQSWFTSPLQLYSADTRFSRPLEDLVSLLFMRDNTNFAYPPNTYADLVFPVLDFESIWTGSGEAIQAAIPAVRMKSTCARVPNEDFIIDENLNIVMNFTCPNGSTISVEDYLLTNATSSTSHVGGALDFPRDEIDLYRHCGINLSGKNHTLFWKTETYVWGRFPGQSQEDKNRVVATDFDHFSIWRCNYSWIEVMAETKLRWVDGRFQINHNDPPLPISPDDSPRSPPLGIPTFLLSTIFPRHPYNDQIPRDDIILPEFYYMLEPYGPLRLEDFGNPDRDDQILEALNRNYGLIWAQLGDKEYRLGINETSPRTHSQHGVLAPVNMTITDNGRHRLLQNPVATYVIVAILSLAVAVNTWAVLSTLLRPRLGKNTKWLLDMELEGLAPKGYNSIAMLEALMHYSNFFGHMEENSHLVPADELHQQLLETRFQLGWSGCAWEQERYFTIRASFQRPERECDP